MYDEFVLQSKQPHHIQNRDVNFFFKKIIKRKVL